MKTVLKRSSTLFLWVLGIYILLFIAPLNTFGHSNTCTVQGAVKINTKSIDLGKGQKYTLKVSGTSRKVTWSTSSSKVATVKNGVVTTKKAGSATITAKVGSKKYKCKITVHNYTINTTSITMSKGKTYTIKIKGTSLKKTYSSSNKSVATVNKTTGVVTAKKSGTTKITAKVGKVKFYVTVKVESPSLNKTKLTLKHGSTYQLKLSTKRSISWSSSDKSIVRVTSKGKVTAYRSGKAYIYAKVNDKVFTCTVVVNTPSVVNIASTISVGLGQKVSYKVTAGDGFWCDSVNNYISCSLSPGEFKAGDSITLTIKGEMVGTDVLTFIGANGYKKTVHVQVKGSKLSATSQSSTINQVAIKSFSAYKGTGTKPWISMSGSITNHNTKPLEAIEVHYTFYNEAKQAIASYIFPVNSPVSGKTYAFSHSFDGSSYSWTSKAKSVKITSVDCLLSDNLSYSLVNEALPFTFEDSEELLTIENGTFDTYYDENHAYVYTLDYNVATICNAVENSSVLLTFELMNKDNQVIVQDKTYSAVYDYEAGQSRTLAGQLEQVRGSITDGSIHSIRVVVSKNSTEI